MTFNIDICLCGHDLEDHFDIDDSMKPCKIIDCDCDNFNISF